MIVRVQLLDDNGNQTAMRDVPVDPVGNPDYMDDVADAIDAMVSTTPAPANAAPVAPTDCWNARQGRKACAKSCGPNGCVMR